MITVQSLWIGDSLSELEALKQEAIAVDDLELALHYKRSASVMRTMVEKARTQSKIEAGDNAAAESTERLLRKRFVRSRL